MHIKRFLQLVATAALIAFPVTASAQVAPVGVMPGPVVGPAPGGLGILSNPIAGGALAGTPADPFATTLHVVPPPGGAVILYDGVRIKGWWVNAGITTLKPGRTYGLVATKGSRMVFNSGIQTQPGVTTVAWRDGDRPRIAYQPPIGYNPYGIAAGAGRVPAQPSAVHHGPRQPRTPAGVSAKPRPTPRSQGMDGRTYATMVKRMRAEGSEHKRFRLMQRYVAKRKLTTAQKNRVMRLFRSRAYKRRAAAYLDGKRRFKRPSRAVAKRRAVAKARPNLRRVRSPRLPKKVRKGARARLRVPRS